MSTGPSRSRSVVALLADIPTTGHLGAAQARRFSLEGDDLASQSGEFLDFASHYAAEGYKIVALYPKWHATRAERAIRFARGSMQSDAVAGVPVDLAPLALSLLADQVTYLSPYLPAGIVATLADELVDHTLAGGWLRSVNNLETIPISLKQHVGSYSPKSTFLAFCSPNKRVGRVRKGDPSPNIPQRPVAPVQLLISAPEKFDHKDFNDQFIPALGCQMAGGLPQQPLGQKYWGTNKYVEFVAFSAHPEALTRPVKGIRAIPCAWCREVVSGLYCHFCGCVNQFAAGKPPTQGTDVPAPPSKTTGEHVRPSWIGRKKNARRQDGAADAAVPGARPSAPPASAAAPPPAPDPGRTGPQPGAQHPNAHPSGPQQAVSAETRPGRPAPQGPPPGHAPSAPPPQGPES